MGVTITIALSFWFASSYLEYRIIKAIPASKKIFDHPVGGIVISITIGLVVGFVMGPAVGIGASLGQLLGLATNKMTYEMFTFGSNMLKSSQNMFADMNTFFAKNKARVTYAANTFRMGIQAIGAFILGILWVIGLPFRIFEWINRRNHV